MISKSNEQIIVTLIHGTFAQNAEWVKSNSFLTITLKNKFPNAIIKSFQWSGYNSKNARLNASNDLFNYTQDIKKTYPCSKHYIIAHSHGGNIVYSNFKKPSFCESISGLVFLSTPFLQVKYRESNVFAPFYLPLYFILLIITQLIITGDKWFLKEPRFAPLPLALLLLVVAFVDMFSWQWSLHSKKFFEKINDEINISDKTNTPALIINVDGDEAFLLLKSVQKINHFSGRLFKLIEILRTYTTEIIFSRLRKNTRNNFYVYLKVLAIVVGLLCLTLLIVLIGKSPINYIITFPCYLIVLFTYIISLLGLASGLFYLLLLILPSLISFVFGSEFMKASMYSENIITLYPEGFEKSHIVMEELSTISHDYNASSHKDYYNSQQASFFKNVFHLFSERHSGVYSRKDVLQKITDWISLN